MNDSKKKEKCTFSNTKGPNCLIGSQTFLIICLNFHVVYIYEQVKNVT